MRLIKDSFLIRADKDSKRVTEITGHNGEKLLLDTDFNKYHHATQIGEVAFAPQIIDSQYVNDTPIKEGDIVVFHHFVCHEDNAVKYKGETLYKCEYFHLWGKIVNDKIEPLEDYIFVDPILEPEENTRTKSGLSIRADRQVLKNTGKVWALCKQAKSLGLKLDDIIFFTNDADYDIKICDHDLYRMSIRNIVGVERNGKLVCLSNKMLVVDETEAEEKGGLIYTKNPREKHGKVCNIGEDIRGISIGDKISYFNGLSSELNYHGTKYSFLKVEDVNYKKL